jgi:hypothetical protein
MFIKHRKAGLDLDLGDPNQVLTGLSFFDKELLWPGSVGPTFQELCIVLSKKGIEDRVSF